MLACLLAVLLANTVDVAKFDAESPASIDQCKYLANPAMQIVARASWLPTCTHFIHKLKIS